MSKILVTGCAGFIGSSLLDRLLKLNHEVIGLDNLSTGRVEFLKNAKNNKKFKFHKFDLYKDKNLEDYFHGIEKVFHLAANADVRDGLNNPTKD